MKYEIDKKRLVIRVVPEREEDLYFIYLLIDKGDIIRGWTVREYKPDGVKEGERIKMYLAIKAEALEYHKFRGSLRVRGPVIEVQEGVEGVKGRRHTFDISIGREIEIEKNEDKPLEVVDEILNMAKNVMPRILLISIDDEEAAFAYITSIGVNVLHVVRNDAERSRGDSLLHDYLVTIGKIAEDLKRRLNPDKVVVTGPHIVVEQIGNYVRGDRVAQSVGGLAGIYEFMRAGLYDGLKTEMGIKAYERLMQLLATERNLVAIGLEEVEMAVAAGRVEILLIVDSYIKEDPHRAWDLIYKVYATRGKIYIIREDLEIGTSLKAMGGVASILRW
ncbi:cell division protein pelota (pelA), conjectural [Pyrobaculum aerophilum str. IM2]|uniref:Protein pelota homolog n=2 Tax=Pyrobaculum aerophilum TaxID=13773 RepID=PELO_PYRAE|nr:pelota family protein [Pyrobaculum aerophilum]Q8ZTE8.1 RecName: Full=Protein pelota homolog [Pyrobaculum aerophilum str. IM2]AAL64813.1 cell division protein pelota (pelA), conjectural [Pyrobaculum aerophilum str. IM2]HII47576.1 pelota family protein [Pyrobaculum aerophilum]